MVPGRDSRGHAEGQERRWVGVGGQKVGRRSGFLTALLLVSRSTGRVEPYGLFAVEREIKPLLKVWSPSLQPPEDVKKGDPQALPQAHQAESLGLRAGTA
jgi:hypothetical protein